MYANVYQCSTNLVLQYNVHLSVVGRYTGTLLGLVNALLRVFGEWAAILWSLRTWNIVVVLCVNLPSLALWLLLLLRMLGC